MREWGGVYKEGSEKEGKLWRGGGKIERGTEMDGRAESRDRESLMEVGALRERSIGRVDKWRENKWESEGVEEWRSGRMEVGE